MSNFLTKDDYKYHLRTNRLDQILESQDEDADLILNAAELDAISIMRDSLSPFYDVNAVFSATGDSRHRTIMRWLKVMVIYFIYERIPDEMCPERVIKNYEHVLEELQLVESGKKNIDGLPPLTVAGGDSNTTPTTRRVWGSIPKRTNDGMSMRDKTY